MKAKWQEKDFVSGIRIEEDYLRIEFAIVGDLFSLCSFVRLQVSDSF